MRAAIALFVAAWAFLAGPAQASVIENGIYYSAAEPGRGYSIEQQGSQMTLIFYVYETSGAPVWYYASGGYVLNGAGYPTMTATLGKYTGGQCLGCTFASPSGTDVGTVTVTFASAQRATLTLGSSSGAFGSGGGSSISLERFSFTDATNPLLGQWSFAYSIASAGGATYANTYGGFVRFTTVGAVVNTGGTGRVTGSPSGYAGECYASGSLAGSCLVTYTSGSFTEYYVITAPRNEWRGYYAILGGSGNTYRVQGVRVAVAGETSLYGVGTAADQVAEDETTMQAAIAARMSADAKAGPTMATDAGDGQMSADMAAAFAKLLGAARQ